MNFIQKVKHKLTPQLFLNKEKMLNELVMFNDWIRDDCTGLPPHIYKQNVSGRV